MTGRSSRCKRALPISHVPSREPPEREPMRSPCAAHAEPMRSPCADVGRAHRGTFVLGQPRGWRHPDLDASLTKKRMTNEIKLTIWLARRGAPVPAIWDVDIEESKIIMERIEGKPLIEILQSNEHDEKLLIDVGKAIRELHRNAVNHGDLSTNNILITNQREVVLIDLGLSSREYDLEGFGIDLHKNLTLESSGL